MNAKLSGLRQPAEWEPHSAVWTAWPSHPAYWEGHIEAARDDIERFLRVLARPIEGCPAPEAVHVWVDGDSAYREARARLEDVSVHWHQQPLGDIWFRDIAPIFMKTNAGPICQIFRNNGWGGKYVMKGDDTVASRIAEMVGLQAVVHDWVFEGGALDVDGNGWALTTRSCLLNPNRNPLLTEAEIDELVHEDFGLSELVWLGDGLINDHTDGHIDNIARFVAPRRVVYQAPWGSDDPNAEVLRSIEVQLRTWRSSAGEPLDLVTIPSPGRVADPDGRVLPASHLNFYIANHAVLVPVYGTASAPVALTQLQELFPTRKVVGLPANGVLMGGGAFHCMTQQQPVC